LEWLYKKLRNHFSTDEILMSLQYVIDGGGEDAEVSNTVNLCGDNIEESKRGKIPLLKTVVECLHLLPVPCRKKETRKKLHFK
jgi:hypothetical protein